VVRAAVWQIAIGLMAMAWLSGRQLAAEPRPADVPAVAPEESSRDSRVEPTADAGPEDPPTTDVTPPQEPPPETVPPGQMEPGSSETSPGGTPLPGIQEVLEDGQPCTPVISSNCWFAPDHWYTNSDFVVNNHNRPKRNTRFAIDVATGNILAEENLTLGITEGARITVGVWRSHDTYGWDHAIEATFNGLEDWHHRFELVSVVPGEIFTFSNVQPPGFSGGDAAFIYAKSQFNSGGLDLRWTKQPGKDALVYDPDGFWKREAESGAAFTFLLGVHDAELDERFSYSVRRNNIAPTVFGGDYSNHTTNNLLGLHVGSELDYKHDLWYVGIRGGSTICVNFAEVDADLSFHDPNPPLGFATSGSHHENGLHTGPGAISELGLVAGWQVRPNVRLRASYDFLWLTGVAPAPAQVRLGAFQPNAIDVSRDLMFTGMSLGLEINW
jgi:hypothetical protein